ncbi:hypothetical protein J2W42_005728 [Rhizobium tibeticum]|nr:hypothetical protein [Rhizobium tibeticum]
MGFLQLRLYAPSKKLPAKSEGRARQIIVGIETLYNPINFQVSKVVEFGEQPVSFGVGARHWADSPENGPDSWGVRAVVTFLFPK